MAKETRIYYDLDFSLYHTAELMADLRNDLQRMGYVAAAIDEAFEQLNDVGYSLEGHLRLLGHREDDIPARANELQFYLSHGEKYLMPGVYDGLIDLSLRADQHLLTFGFPQYQQAKFSGLGDTALSFHGAHFVWKGDKKGDVIANAGQAGTVWFLDDSPAHLEDACQKAPWVKAVRMMWPEFKLKPDNRDHIHWDVVRSFDEFVALVKRGG